MHFVAGMNVTRLLGDDYAVRKHSACFINSTETGEELAELEVSCHIRWVVVKEYSIMINGFIIISQFCAFVRQSVSGKRIAWFCRDKLLKHFTARLLRWGHGVKRRIIFFLQ